MNLCFGHGLFGGSDIVRCLIHGIERSARLPTRFRQKLITPEGCHKKANVSSNCKRGFEPLRFSSDIWRIDLLFAQETSTVDAT